MDETLKEITDLIDRYWKFNEDQEPLSTWHDKQELLLIISNKIEKLKCQIKDIIHTNGVLERRCRELRESRRRLRIELK